MSEIQLAEAAQCRLVCQSSIARSSTYGKPIVAPNNAAMMNNRDISCVADWPDEDSNVTSIRTGHFSDQLLSITKLNQQSALPHRRTRQLRSPRLYHAFPAPLDAN